MKLIRNSGSDRVIDLIKLHLGPGNQLDFITPKFSLFAFEQLRSILFELGGTQLILPSKGPSSFWESTGTVLFVTGCRLVGWRMSAQNG